MSNWKSAVDQLKECYNGDPAFEEFIHAFSEVFIKPAIQLTLEGKEEEAKVFLKQAFGVAAAVHNPEAGLKIFSNAEKETQSDE